MNKHVNNFFLFFNTLRYLKAAQIIHYISFFLKKKLLNRFIISRISNIKKIDLKKTSIEISKPIPPYILDCDISNNKFVFLNEKIQFKNTINWNSTKIDKLWIYNLHYFDYILAFINDNNHKNYRSLKSIILSWINDNPLGKGIGWDPYPSSIRIVNWIFFYNKYYEFIEKDTEFNKFFIRSLYQQASYLNYFPELHILANHIFANLKALFFAAVFFQNKKLFLKVWEMLCKQLQEQILGDGGHYERSPMYHSIILLDILDLINLIISNKYILGLLDPITWINKKFDQKIGILVSIAEKMLNWLYYMKHPDGKIGLFGDSAFNIVPDFIYINDYFNQITNLKSPLLQKELSITLKPSGYLIFNNSNNKLIIDSGELGVKYQPGHAHCDLLSYEYSYKNKRFIVDSGVGSYSNVDLRMKARSIYSHNTVVVNKLEQGEIWKIFRMGKRVKQIQSRLLKTEHDLNGEVYYYNDIHWNQKYSHRRTIRFIDQSYFIIEDEISGNNIKMIENLIHICPDCQIEINLGEIKLSIDNTDVYILYNPGELNIIKKEWFYVPEFGKVLNSYMTVLNPNSNKLRTLKYIIVPSEYRQIVDLSQIQ